MVQWNASALAILFKWAVLSWSAHLTAPRVWFAVRCGAPEFRSRLLYQAKVVDGCVEPRIFGEQADAMVAIVVKETVQGGGWVCGQSSACRSSMALW